MWIESLFHKKICLAKQKKKVVREWLLSINTLMEKIRGATKVKKKNGIEMNLWNFTTHLEIRGLKLEDGL